MDQNAIYAFGEFRLDTATRLLRHQEASVGLQPKIYCLLLYFLQHPGRLLSREEIFDGVWQGTVVEDTSLRLAVNFLRLALHDQSKAPHYILTVNKHGYRFLPEVRLEYASDRKQTALLAAGSSYRPADHIPAVLQNFPTELAELLEIFEDTADSNRRLVFLNGPRSIGKTTLLENFLAAIRPAGYGMLRARCLQLSGAGEEPFLPLLEALERRCLESCGKPLINTLHRIAPTWLYQMLNVLEPEELATLHPKVLQINSGRMLREGADFFEAMSRDSALVLILDNAQWSDPFTLDLLNLLASRCSPAKLMVIISYRPSQNGDCVRRIEKMREELSHRGLCREFCLESNYSARSTTTLPSGEGTSPQQFEAFPMR